MYQSCPDPAQQRPYLYPLIWALYFIGFIVIAHCFDTNSSSASLPSVHGSHLAAVLGLASFDQEPCETNCRTQQSAPLWAGLHLASTAENCSNISINPNLQTGCGLSLGSTPSASPNPDAELSASAPAELPAPNEALLTASPLHTTTHTSDDTASVQ